MNEFMETTGGFSSYNAVDFVVVALLALGLFTGLRRGLSGELAGVISAGVALVAGWKFYQPAGRYVFEMTRLSNQASNALAFVLVLIGAWILMVLLRLVLRHIMEFTFKGHIERIGGALAGLLRALAVVTAAILMLSLWPHEYLHRIFAQDSFCGRLVYAYLEPVYNDLSQKYPVLPDVKKLGEEPPSEPSEPSKPAQDRPSEPAAEREP